MRLSSGLARWVVAGVALLFLSSQVMAAPKEAKEGKAPKEGKGETKAAKGEKAGKEGKKGEGKAPPSTLTKDAQQLANPRSVMESDPIEVAATLFQASLSEQQKAQLAQLTQDRSKEERQVISQLDNKFADKVKTEVLASAQQKAQFDAVIAALNKCRAALCAASDELAAKVGAEIASQVVQTGKAPAGPQLFRYLGLTKEQQDKIGQCYAEMKKANEDARATIQEPADKTDKDARKAYNDQMEAARKKAESDFDTKVNALLTAEQKQKKDDIVKAADTLGQKIKAAMDTLRADLAAIK